MTFVLAARFGDDIIFFADTAVTTPGGTASESHTSFLQMQQRDDESIVEAQLKIVHLPPFVLSFAGSLGGARRFVHYIDQHRSKARPSELLERAASEALEHGTNYRYDIIAAYAEEHAVHVWRLSTNGNIVRDVPGWYVAGAPPAQFGLTMASRLESAEERGESALVAIDRVVAHFQWEAANDDLLGRYKSGGAFAGAVLRSDGTVEWQRDSIFHFYSRQTIADIREARRNASAPPRHEPVITGIACRSNAILVCNRSHAITRKALVWSPETAPSTQEIERALAALDSGQAHTYTFVCVDAPRVVIVHAENSSPSNRAFQWHVTKDEWEHFVPSDQLLDALDDTRGALVEGHLLTPTGEEKFRRVVPRITLIPVPD